MSIAAPSRWPARSTMPREGRVPVFIFAGISPFTQEGELPGSRNEFIQWLQDVHDQRGIVRQYMKYDNELRTGRNVKQIVHRAMQFAHSDPMGPVYLVAAREVMEESVEPVAVDVSQWSPVASLPLPADGVAAIAEALAGARRPLVVTSYVGRNPDAVPELMRLCDRLGVGVLESAPAFMNFPHDNDFYHGNQWNEPFQNPQLAEADVVLVIDSDVPWIPTVSRPAAAAAIFHIDIDPLKEAIPLWYIKARQTFRADARYRVAPVECASGDDEARCRADRGAERNISPPSTPRARKSLNAVAR